MNAALESLLPKLPFAVERALAFADGDIKRELCEIRLRADMPVALTLPRKTVFLHPSGRVCDTAGKDVIVSSADELYDCYLKLCDHSVYAHAAEIKEGFISLGHGCRAGVCGRFFDGRPARIFSLNVRIARQVPDCALPLLPFADKGLLIAGPPGSGKTTLLRDAVRLLSEKGVKTCVIDSRQEISSGFDLGAFCDVIIHKDKARGAEIALRTMSPQVIAFDEIGTAAELGSVADMFCAGVNILTTAHAADPGELISRSVTRRLLESGAVKYAALLSGAPGGEIKIAQRKELETCRWSK